MEGDAVDWRSEARVAAVVTLFVALLGAVVGRIWYSVAPSIDVPSMLAGSTATTKALVGDDLWLALLGIVAGVACVLLLVLVAPRVADGPGAQLGLAIGGVLGMLVAARVGYLIGVPDLTAAIRAAVPGATDSGVHYVVGIYGFKVRATAVLLTWPLTSVLVGALITWVRAVNAPTLRALPTYPGSP